MAEGNKTANNHFLNKDFQRINYMEEGDNTLTPVAKLKLDICYFL